MKWCTEVIRVNPITGDRDLFIGEDVEAKTMDEAQDWLDSHGKGYLTVTPFVRTEEEDWPPVQKYSNISRTLSRKWQNEN